MARRPDVASLTAAGSPRHVVGRPVVGRQVVGRPGALVPGRGGDDERARRRLVGPLASAVLADLALDAEYDGAGVGVVTTSARQVATHLGVGKDTAARALRRLAAIGLVERRPQRPDPGGRFGPGSYELRVAAPMATSPCPRSQDTVRGGGAAVDASDTVPASNSADTVSIDALPRRRRPAPGRSEAGQLSLLEIALDSALDSGSHREPS